MAAWLVGCFLPRGTYPVLQASGRHGSGKTTMQDALRKLVDPRTVKAPVGLPKDQEQFILAARSSFIAAYNNVSYVDNSQNDWLCCLVEGTATNKRTLYTTAGETIFSVKRPVLLNGIGSATVRGDLLDRSLLVAIQPPAEQKREEELWASYNEARPRILGALLSAVATALGGLAEITIPDPEGKRSQHGTARVPRVPVASPNRRGVFVRKRSRPFLQPPSPPATGGAQQGRRG